MSDELRELYQEVILDHARNPRNYGAPEGDGGQKLQSWWQPQFQNVGRALISRLPATVGNLVRGHIVNHQIPFDPVQILPLPLN